MLSAWSTLTLMPQNEAPSRMLTSLPVRTSSTYVLKQSSTQPVEAVDAVAVFDA